jgi:uncharacterized protein (TIGR02594 family)
MPNRDIQLVVRAKDEASRALNQVAEIIGQLNIEQKGATASGRTFAATIAETVVQMAQMEKVTGLVVNAANRAEAAINRQRSAVAESVTQLAAVTRQLQAARDAIDAQQSRVVDARLAGGSGDAEVGALKAAQAAAAELERRQTSLTRTLAQQQATMEGQERNFREIAAGANTAEAALGSFGDESARASLKVAGAAEEAADALRRQTAAQEESNRAASARSFFDSEPVTDGIRARETALADLLRAEQAQEDMLERLRDRIDPLAAVERRLAADTRVLEKAFADGRIDAKQFEVALENLKVDAENARAAFERRGQGANGKVSLFGLKPYELTNLGYQVNDVITQLASGTSPLQVMAQQGGQILQLVPNLSGKLIGLFQNPYFLAAAAPMIALGAALREAAADADRLRKIEAMMSAIGSESGYTAEELSAVAESVERIGFSAEESTALVRTFLTQGLNLDYLHQFAQAARNMADVAGIELPDAMKQQEEAFTAGYEAIAALDDRLPFLTLSEREHIRVLFESGEAAEGRAQAFAVYRREMDEQAGKARGSWTSAVRTLDRSFSDLLDTLGNTDFTTNLLADLENLVRGIEITFTDINDLTREQLERQIATIQERQESLAWDPLYQFSPQASTDEIELEEYQRRLALIQDTVAAEGDLVDEESAASRKRESDQLAAIDRENELSNARTAAQRIAIEGEQAYQRAVAEGHTQRVAQARREQAMARQRREEDRRAEQEQRRREDAFSESIANNGREGLLRTAQGFVGRNENNSADAGVLSELFRAANINIDPDMIAWCAAFVNAVLATNGLPTVSQSGSGSDLRARDFLGYGSEVTRPEPGDIVILKRPGGGAGAGHVGFFRGFAENGDVRVLGGNQGDGVNEQTFRARDVLGFRRAPSQGDEAERQFAEDERRLDKQREFNEEIDAENEARRRNTEYLREQNGLSGESLLDAQRRQAVEEAVADAQTKALRDEIELGAERLQQIRDTVGAEFDVANARERATAALDDATFLREALLGQLALADEQGDSAAVRALEGQIDAVDASLARAIRSAQDLFAQFDNPQAEASVRELGTQLDRLALDRRRRAQERVEAPVRDLQAQRNALLEQAQTFSDLGETAVADQLREQVRAVDQQLLAAIDSTIAFWQAQSGPDAQAAVLTYQNLRNQVVLAQNEFVITAAQLQDAFAGSLTDAVDVFAQRLVETKDPLDALAMGALSFAADFTRKLAEMGLEMLALKLASKIGFADFAGGFNSALGNASMAASAASLGAAGTTVAAGGVAVTTGAAALATSAGALMAAAQMLLVANSVGSAGVFHGGGIAGSANRARAVSPLWFTAAVRYHSGGIAGLRPNEVPTILERGEEVLTRSDARHRFNGGRSAPDATYVEGRRSRTEILAIGDKEIAAAMNSASGEEVILRVLRRNRENVRIMVRD